METQPQRQASSTQEICFPNGNCAQALFLPAAMAITDTLFPILNIPQPHAVLMIAGGASSMDERLYPNLRSLFTDGIAHLAVSLGALIIDGGTQAGVMEMMGTGIAEQQHKSTLLGISPAGCITYPGQSAPINSAESAPLDPNHSHFVLVETDEWGGETQAMYELAQLFSAHCPSVALVINGGSITRKEVLYNVRQTRPIIVIEGSGRVADDIARCWREQPSIPSDPEIAEIVQHGDIHLFPITGAVTELVQLAQELLRKKAT